MAKNKKEMETLNDENLEKASGGFAGEKLTRSGWWEEIPNNGGHVDINQYYNFKNLDALINGPKK